MFSTLIFALFCVTQTPPDNFPAEDHAWRRFKAGTWISNALHIERAGNIVETVQKQTLKEKAADDYAIEVTESVHHGDDLPTRINRTSNGVFVGKETLTVDGKEVPCRISLSQGKRAEGETEYRYWMPEGNKVPLKVVFKQPGMEGELVAVALDEKVKVGEREYSCAKLKGKIKRGALEGTMTLWTTQEIPGAQARMELILKDPNAETKITMTPIEVHEEK